MSETRTTTFRLPSKYIVFLESLANDAESDRTKELIAILDWAMQIYLKNPTQFQKALTQLKHRHCSDTVDLKKTY